MHYIRNIFEKLYRETARKEVTILLGPRQVGKTYLLKQLQSRLPKTRSSAFFNLEIPEDARRFIGSREEIFHLLTHAGDVVFIDEFHYLKNEKPQRYYVTLGLIFL